MRTARQPQLGEVLAVDGHVGIIITSRRRPILVVPAAWVGLQRSVLVAHRTWRAAIDAVGGRCGRDAGPYKKGVSGWSILRVP